MGYLSDAEKSIYADAMYTHFETFRVPFQLYLEGQKATISTSPTYSRFGDHGQNTPISTDNTAINPVSYTVSGCILYGNNQPWEYIEPGSRGNYQQDKIRESQGVVRIKVDATGAALFATCKMVNLDGFDFKLNSNVRPQRLAGVTPNRYTITLEKAD